MENDIKVGKLIIRTLAVFFGVMQVTNAMERYLAGEFDILTFALGLLIAVLLFRGVRWIKWIIVLLAGVYATYLFAMLSAGTEVWNEAIAATGIAQVMATVSQMVIYISMGVIMLFSKKVQAFHLNEGRKWW